MKNKNVLITYFLFFIFSLSLTIFFVGVDNFWFNKTNWLYGLDDGDSKNAQLSWQFFQNDVWRFPLGRNPNYGLEISNSIIFTDSIPLFAILFKILKPLINENFQYISFWIFTCFFLQILISFKLINKLTNDYYFSLIVSFIFIFTPFLLFRLQMHFSLGAHWIILYTFYVAYFIPFEQKKIHWYFLIFLSLMIHLYFTVMVFVIYFFSIFENILKDKLIKKRILDLIYKILFSIFIMYIVGYFESNPINAVSSGYGIFKIDVLSFLDPKPDGEKTWSLFLKDLNGTHIEGFTYLGLGNIFLIFLAIIILLTIKLLKNHQKFDFIILRPLNLCFIIFLIWSLSSNISILGYEILSFDIPKYLYAILSIFSSTGRFSWPVIYFIFLISFYFIYKFFSKKISLLIVLLVLIIQISDTSFRIFNNDNNLEKISKKGPSDKIWKIIEQDFEIIRTTYLFNNYGPLFNNFSSVLSELKGIKTDIILNAAMDRQKAATVRYELTDMITKGNLVSNTAYIVDNLGQLKHLKKEFGDKNYGFFYRDNFWIVLPGKRNLMSESDFHEFKKIKISQIKLNKQYDLKFKDEFLGFGWSHNFGNAGVWSEGKNSFLLMSQYGEKKNINLHLNFKPYQSNLSENFTLEILANNKTVRKINFYNNKEEKEIVINLDKNQFNNELIIHFKFSGLISPFNILESPDARQLGILLNSFELREIR